MPEASADPVPDATAAGEPPTPAGARRAASPDRTVLEAPAKLTTTLRVVGRRHDGYHLLEAEMVTVDLADTLTIVEGASGITMAGSAASDVVPLDESNLVAKALALVGRTAAVHLHKRIPAGAGLGGGSADAAAVLRWAGVDDPEAAATLGADVPFCVRGGRALVRGVGEILEPLPAERQTFTLLTPPLSCDTAAVYRAWDDLGGPTSHGTNDLEPAALVVEPRLARWRDELAEASGREPSLAGSGSTWFVEGDHPGPGRIVVRTVGPSPDPSG